MLDRPPFPSGSASNRPSVGDVEVLDPRLRAIVEACPAPMALTSESGRIQFANSHAERLFRTGTGGLAGEPIEVFVPDAGLALRPRARAMAHGVRLRGRRRDGTDMPVDLSLGPILTDAGAMWLVLITDVTQQVESEREVFRLATDLRQRIEDLGEALRAKDVLLREVHHRVKNNLQIVSSLLSLQARRVGDDNTRRLFEESRDRLLSMSLVHEQLYASGNIGRIDFAAYLRTLIAEIARSHLEQGSTIEIVVRSKSAATLGIDTAVPAGLIVHELVTNSVKHGYPHGGPGRIVVSLESLSGGEYALCVEDDGVGIEDPIAPPEGSSLGRRIIGLLAQQLDADLEVDCEAGTRVCIRFRDLTASEVP